MGPRCSRIRLPSTGSWAATRLWCRAVWWARAAAQEFTRIFRRRQASSSVGGKSHTLSYLLENCLLGSEANVLPRPLTGIVFHYDSFISDTAGSPCEAAYLSSHKDITVRNKCDANQTSWSKNCVSTKRMLDLMAVSSSQLCFHVVTRKLRDLRVVQQTKNCSFNYTVFKQALDLAELTVAQSNPLQHESFMVTRQVQEQGLSPTGATGQ
ncbi:hypothetical protein CDD82_6856 [Ophiocordyceps australis]|uniref:Uncharacterized protein n=1 Tax=Ophiocordyceps australis TaxID=1399860 RepID=A0A2C5YT46_9HYPO|nr:hypothetical protein CDD82_6856 [Ophiocordyceps australis]